MSALRHGISFLSLCLMSACVVRLSDGNAALPNGGVSGPAADCNATSIIPREPTFGDPAPRFVGRVDTSEPGKARFAWSGTQVKARFTGTSITMLLTSHRQPIADTTASISDPTAYTIVIDDRAPFKVDVTQYASSYLLANDLAGDKEHEIVVHRNVEAEVGVADFLGFTLSEGASFLPAKIQQRRIEILGDSITCGFGNEGANASCAFSTTTENNYLAYGSIAGRELAAEVTTVCYSGRGVSRNNTGDTAGTAPLLYRYTIPTSALDEAARATAAVCEDTSSGSIPADPNCYRFADSPPHAVVIALGTNDWFLGIPDLAAFQNAYRDLILFIRSKYPEAHIFCALSPMLNDSADGKPRTTTRAMISNVVAAFNAANDPRVYSMEFLEQDNRNGLGCAGHPNLVTHERLAEQLVGAVRSKLCW